ncbi:MAG: transglycosylase SLT domain-containing protein [Anaerolineae bacterium]
MMTNKYRHFNCFGVWASVLIIALFVYPFVANSAMKMIRQQQQGVIAPLFTDQVQHWEDQIALWSDAYEINPNLMATIMQIESCGHPTVVSHAGARGLFQVMPFHFDNGENMLDPHTNAFRSANFIRECTGYADGDIGLILACYNGGPSVTMRDFSTWPDETQRYYVWGLSIYRDAIGFQTNSATLNEWLQAGGSHLCNSASVALSQYR